MTPRLLCLLGVLVLLAGCAGGPTPVAAPPPDPAVLEALRERNRDNPDELLRIGIAFYEAGAYERSRDVLQAALALRPGVFLAEVRLGLAWEALDRPEEAAAAYLRARGLWTGAAERRLVDARLAGLTRARLAADARRALAAEAELAAAPPLPNTVAVLPWTYLGGDSALRPLERGLAHLVVSDLAKVGRLTLLERERVQALADELALGGAGRVDPTSAARSGRLLRAADVVQGTIREAAPGQIRLDGQVVNTTSAEVRASGTAADRLSQLFELEKTVVFALLDRMGIALTPAERRAIQERPTGDLQAFLAFSRALEAEDLGRFREAEALFRQAAARDPAFRMARERAALSARMADAGLRTPAQFAAFPARSKPAGAPAGLTGTPLGSALQGIAPTLAGRLGNRHGRQPPPHRARLAEALRQDDPARLGTFGQLVVIIPRP